MRKLFALIFCISFSAHGAVQTIDWNNRKFKLNFDSEWKTAQNFFGIPVTLFGPMSVKKVRTIIQIIPTEANALLQNETELKAFNRTYPENKKKWLKARSGSILSVLPAAIEENDKKQKMVVAGLAYRLGDQAFTEKTYYINCKSKVVQLKLLVPLGESEHLARGEKVVRSFECDN